MQCYDMVCNFIYDYGLDTRAGLVCAVPYMLPNSHSNMHLCFLLSLKLIALVAEYVLEDEKKHDFMTALENAKSTCPCIREFRLPHSKNENGFACTKDVTHIIFTEYKRLLPTSIGGKAPSKKSILQDARLIPVLDIQSCLKRNRIRLVSRSPLEIGLLLQTQKVKKLITIEREGVFTRCYPSNLIDYKALQMASDVLGIVQSYSNEVLTILGKCHIGFGWKYLRHSNPSTISPFSLPSYVQHYLFSCNDDGLLPQMPIVSDTMSIFNNLIIFLDSKSDDVSFEDVKIFMNEYPQESIIISTCATRLIMDSQNRRQKNLEEFILRMANYQAGISSNQDDIQELPSTAM